MPQPRHGRPLALLVTFLAIFVLLGSVFVTPASSSVSPYLSSRSLSPPAQATREPGMMFDPADRLAPPPMSDPPTQVEQGHYVYYLSCMVCHGDRGQGLTDEWRGALDPADQNCWQSKCHAPNHPPEGFELPRTAPAIIGPGRLAHHQIAAGLYQYIRARMPWQAPGLLSDEEYWQLTAFLIDANGLPLGEAPLGPENAANVRLDQQASAVSGPPSAVGPLAVGGLLLLSGALVIRRRARNR